MGLGNNVGMPENMEEKTICCLVLDDSGSMNGSPINELNKGIQSFTQDIENDDRLSNQLEIAVVKFGKGFDVLQEPALIANVSIPALKANDGQTDLNEGVREGIRLVEERKTYYKQTNQMYKRPWIVVISDGAPTDSGLEQLAAQIEEDTKNLAYVLLTIGVNGADMATLQKLSGYMGDQKMSPMSMDSAKFGEFFKWLSHSMQIVVAANKGQQVGLADPSGWMKGMTV